MCMPPLTNLGCPAKTVRRDPKDGSKRLGRLGRETKESLELIDAAGQSSRIPAKQITGREMASVSLMPPGLERLLTPQELADLVAYLKRLK